MVVLRDMCREILAVDGEGRTTPFTGRLLHTLPSHLIGLGWGPVARRTSRGWFAPPRPDQFLAENADPRSDPGRRWWPAVAGAKLSPEDIVAARSHMVDGKLKAREVAKLWGIGEQSLWRNLNTLQVRHSRRADYAHAAVQPDELALAARDLSKRPALLLIGLDGIHLRPACPRDSWLTQRGSL